MGNERALNLTSLATASGWAVVTGGCPRSGYPAPQHAAVFDRVSVRFRRQRDTGTQKPHQEASHTTMERCRRLLTRDRASDRGVLLSRSRPLLLVQAGAEEFEQAVVRIHCLEAHPDPWWGHNPAEETHRELRPPWRNVPPMEGSKNPRGRRAFRTRRMYGGCTSPGSRCDPSGLVGHLPL